MAMSLLLVIGVGALLAIAVVVGIIAVVMNFGGDDAVSNAREGWINGGNKQEE